MIAMEKVSQNIALPGKESRRLSKAVKQGRFTLLPIMRQFWRLGSICVSKWITD